MVPEKAPATRIIVSQQAPLHHHLASFYYHSQHASLTHHALVNGAARLVSSAIASV